MSELSADEKAAMYQRHLQFIANRHAEFKRIKDQGAAALDRVYGHCLDCGKIESVYRTGCSCWDGVPSDALQYAKGVECGSMIIEELDESSAPISKEFLSNADLRRRLLAGERFFELSKAAVEVTLDDFKGGE